MKFVLLIDGGYARALARTKSQDGGYYSPDFIRHIYQQCRMAPRQAEPLLHRFSSDTMITMEHDEWGSLLRVLYYDAPPFQGTRELPVSGKKKHFFEADSFLRQLANLDYIAVRRGHLKFQAWTPRTKEPRKDEDYRPVFVQKGVDTRMTLDIATFCQRKTVDRIVLLCGDTDIIPAMKYARESGIQVTLLQLPYPAQKLSPNLLAHCDFVHPLQWPVPAPNLQNVTSEAK